VFKLEDDSGSEPELKLDVDKDSDVFWAPEHVDVVQLVQVVLLLVLVEGELQVQVQVQLELEAELGARPGGQT
jgi:hypothetical protein